MNPAGATPLISMPSEIAHELGIILINSRQPASLAQNETKCDEGLIMYGKGRKPNYYYYYYS
jgi:hypothetical protein